MAIKHGKFDIVKTQNKEVDFEKPLLQWHIILVTNED